MRTVITINDASERFRPNTTVTVTSQPHTVTWKSEASDMPLSLIESDILPVLHNAMKALDKIEAAHDRSR